MVQDAALAQHLASKIKSDSFNVAFIMPQPDVKGRVEMKTRLRKSQGSFQDTVLLTGHLHVLSGVAPETVRKTIQTTTQITQRTRALRMR